MALIIISVADQTRNQISSDCCTVTVCDQWTFTGDAHIIIAMNHPDLLCAFVFRNSELFAPGQPTIMYNKSYRSKS